MKKATIKQEVSFEGVGLHSGEFSRIVLHPNDGGSVRFLIKGEVISAYYQYVVNTNHSTDLGKKRRDSKDGGASYGGPLHPWHRQLGGGVLGRF
jgi:UDP-3-O-acyl-N-acetylglucosamine deacetylase